MTTLTDLEIPVETDYLNCIRCGLCLSVCPTYREYLSETTSPRGRVALVRKGLEGQLELSPNLIEQMYGCFACMACNEVCPVGIRPADLTLAMRFVDPRLLLAMGRVALGKAEILLAGDETFGRLALLVALAWIERAADAGPDDAEAAPLLGDVAVRAGESRKAADAYRRAAGLRPGDGEVRFLLAGALVDMGKHREALAALDEAAGLLGPDPRVLLRRGECLAALGDAEEAEAALLTLVRAEADAERPGSEPARRGLLVPLASPCRARAV